MLIVVVCFEPDFAPDLLPFSDGFSRKFGISALGRTSVQFAEPGIKVNGDYYRSVLLRQGLLR